MEFDLDAELSSLFENTPPPKREFRWFYVNIWKHAEGLCIKWIPDSNGVPMKILHNTRDGGFAYGDETVRLRTTDPSDFKNINESQKKLLLDIDAEMDRYIRLHPDEWKFKKVKTHVLFFGAIARDDIQFDVLSTSLLMANNIAFVNQFKSFVADSKIFFGDGFVRSFMNRNEKSDFITIKPIRNDYMIDYYFDYVKHDEIGLEVPEEAYERAIDLDREYVDVLEFRDDIYEDAFRKLREVNDAAQKGTTISASLADIPKPEFGQN